MESDLYKAITTISLGLSINSYKMEFKAPTNHHTRHLRLLLLLRLVFLLILACIPFASPSGLHDKPIYDLSSTSSDRNEQTGKAVNAEEHSVEHAQSCRVPAEDQCRPCPSAFGLETYKDQNDLGPFIHQRLMELSFEVVRTIDMLKLLNEPNSEFNDVHEGAKRLRDASHKLLGKKLEPQYACLVK